MAIEAVNYINYLFQALGLAPKSPNTPTSTVSVPQTLQAGNPDIYKLIINKDGSLNEGIEKKLLESFSEEEKQEYQKLKQDWEGKKQDLFIEYLVKQNNQKLNEIIEKIVYEVLNKNNSKLQGLFVGEDFVEEDYKFINLEIFNDKEALLKFLLEYLEKFNYIEIKNEIEQIVNNTKDLDQLKILIKKFLIKAYKLETKANNLFQIFITKIDSCLSPKNNIEFQRLLYENYGKLDLDKIFLENGKKIMKGEYSSKQELLNLIREFIKYINYNLLYRFLVENNLIEDNIINWDINNRKKLSLERKTWAEKQEISPNKNIYCSHGGGWWFLQEFLNQKNIGYPLEHNKGYGIQVHANENLRESYTREKRERTFYTESAFKRFDQPAIFHFQIKAQYLDSTANGFEAGLRFQFLEHIQDCKLENLQTGEIIEAKDYKELLEKLSKTT